ncbi:ribosomal-protein-alanine N-acetyltransferase [Mobilisporobacter senegalensis]|uniref:[Ribosomal protein bS18]-alanine N-acetyltransferase n=1 Tax=Mobilisporobacter senegalensis TaxID=1329262 RepID=A0A3N1X540_9FIRM|nr:ribosomal protein S18-alanine N-acetyltransferase [Mobilisporobacter senegalensis]ROR21899.1 ribosomal-protein-alanine N-acetyltransferase [Mobilisporobacter senegalensis]
MTIRPMEEKDLEQVYQIEQESFAQPWTYQDFEQAIDNTNSLYLKLYLVAEEEGEIIGYCGLWGIAGEGQINNVAVKKEYRGKHVGNQMLHELIQLGLNKNLTAFTLEVRVSNQSAIKLYHNLKFEDVGIRKNFYDYPKEDAIIMWLKYEV